MTPTLLRQLWALVEQTQSQILLDLDDPSLVQWLLRHLGAERSLDRVESAHLHTYIYSRLCLIRDLAQERQGV